MAATRDGYDPNEVRQQMQLCFSRGELRQLALNLGVPDEGTSAVAEAVRDVVRHFERAGGLEPLMQELRRLKPLVEWPVAAAPQSTVPDSTWAPATLGPSPGSLGPSPGSLEPTGTVEAAPLDANAPTEGAPPRPPGPTIDDAPASRGAPPLLDLTPPPFPASSDPSPPESTQAPMASAQAPARAEPWLLSPVKKEQPRGLDPRILIAVAGIMLAAVLIAFLAGRSLSKPDEPTGSSDAGTDTAAEKPTYSNGISGRAAKSFDDALAAVARTCDTELEGATSEEVFAIAFDACGERTNPIRRPKTDKKVPLTSLPRDPVPMPDEPDDDDDEPDNSQRPVTGPTKLPKTGSGCLNSCSDQHQGCKSGCGPEPTQSSDYQRFNACTGKCMTSFSKCRLRC